jgi:hypothetical protein
LYTIYKIIFHTCSSERPTCPIGGWENTAEGIALLGKKKEVRISA